MFRDNRGRKHFNEKERGAIIALTFQDMYPLKKSLKIIEYKFKTRSSIFKNTVLIMQFSPSIKNSLFKIYYLRTLLVVYPAFKKYLIDPT